MVKDFRASQIQTTKIISSGSSGTNAKIVFYPIEKQLDSSPNQGIIDPTKFGTGSIGSDIFVYVSGGIGEKNTTNNSITVFGGDVHISGNLSSNQTIPSENLFRLKIVDFASTTNTASNPLVAGQVVFPANEFSGSTITLRAILASTDPSGISAIKLFNLDTMSFVDINGASQQELAVTGTTPTLVESVNLLSASGFQSSSVGLYELQLFSNTGSISAQVGGGEFRPSGSFAGNATVINNISTAGQWVDGGGQLRTTASVSISGESEFASSRGEDVFFFVSGTFGSGSSGDKVAVFGGDVRISGTLAVGTGSAFISENEINLAGATINSTSGTLTFSDNNNPSGQTLTQIISASSVGWEDTGTVVKITSSIEVTGSGVFTSGITGALNVLPDGSPSLVAGIGISISTGSNGQIIISGSSVSSVTTITGTFSLMNDSQGVIGVSASSSPTIVLPSSPNIGQTFTIKDIAGTAFSTNIIVSSSTDQIDGASIHTIAINYGSARFVYFGNVWGVV